VARTGRLVRPSGKPASSRIDHRRRGSILVRSRKVDGGLNRSAPMPVAATQGRRAGWFTRRRPPGVSPPFVHEVSVTDALISTIEEHTYSNGLVLIAETMPGVQSAAFTLLLPAGAAYEGADGLRLGGGAATMAAEWITRGAGPRDSHELLTALDN